MSITGTSSPEDLAITASAAAKQEALNANKGTEEADRLAAQALGHVYATMLAYNESQTASEQVVSMASAADALAEQIAMTLEQQAVAAAQAAITAGRRNNMTQEQLRDAMLLAAVAAVGNDANADAATKAAAAGLAVAFLGAEIGLTAEEQAHFAAQAAQAAATAASGGGDAEDAATAGIRASGVAAVLSGLRNNASSTVAEIAALAAQAAADTAVRFGLSPIDVVRAAAMVAAEAAASQGASAAEQAAAAAAAAAVIGLQQGLTQEESSFAAAAGAGETAQRISAAAGDSGTLQAQKAAEAAAAAAAACGLNAEHQVKAAAAAAADAALQASLTSEEQISAAADAAATVALQAGIDEATTADLITNAKGAAAAANAAASGASLQDQVAAAAQAAFAEAVAQGLLDTQQAILAAAAAAAAVFQDQVLSYDSSYTCSDGAACAGNQCCSASEACPSAHPAFNQCGNSHALVLADGQIAAATQWATEIAGQVGLASVKFDLGAQAAGEAAAEASRERGDNCTEQATAAGMAAAAAAANGNLTAREQVALAAAAAAAAAARSSALNGNFESSTNCSSKQGQMDAAARIAEAVARAAGLPIEEVVQAILDAVRAAEWEATHPSNRTTTYTSTSSTVTSTTTLPVVICLPDESDCSHYMLHSQRCQANCTNEDDILSGYQTCIITSNTSARYYGTSYCIGANDPAVAQEQRDYVLGSVTVNVNSTTPVTTAKAREALASLIGIHPDQIEELNATLVGDSSDGSSSYVVDYVIKTWSLEEAQQQDPTATDVISASSILWYSYAVRTQASPQQAAFVNFLQAQEVEVISLKESPVLPTILSVTTISEVPPSSGDGSSDPDAASSLGMAIAVVTLLVVAALFVLVVVCCSKIQQARLVQAKAEKEAMQEVARAEEMQDNFDMVRTKISVMLPKLEPGHGPMVGRIQHVMEENDFEPVDDVLPDERETLQSSGRRRSLRNFAQADAFTLDIGDEVLSPEDRTAVAQMTGRNEKDTERSLRRLGLDEADLSDNRGVFGTQSIASAGIPDDHGADAPSTSIKPSPVVTSYMSWKSPKPRQDAASNSGIG